MNNLKCRTSALNFICLILFCFASFQTLAQQGLKVEYYDGQDFDRLIDVSTTSNIDQNWDRYPPVSGMDPHVCSIRWTGKIKTPQSGKYEFSARVDDGIRVWIGDQLIINQWDLNDVGIFENDIELIAHQEYDIRVDYFNALNEGEIQLRWKIPNQEEGWFDYFFGDDESVVIDPAYFFQPEQPEPIEEEPAAVTKVTPKIEVPKSTKSTPKKKAIVATIPEPQPKVEAPINIVTERVVEKYIPKNIAFEQGKVTIIESSFQELNSFATFMLAHPELTVKIEGHTDPVGDELANLELSKQRAYKIGNYLVGKGIDNSRIEAEGFGGTQPLFVPANGGYYPANRRVVFKVSGY